METFALAAITLTIAVSLLIKRKKTSVHVSFAFVCLAVCLEKTGAFSYVIFKSEAFNIIKYIGLLLIPPFLIAFSRTFLGRRTILSKRYISLVGLGSLVIASGFFTPFYHWPYLDFFLYLYAGAGVAYSFIALIQSIRISESGFERNQRIYVAIACGVAVLISISDIYHYLGYGMPSLANIATAGLIYFTLVVIMYPRLPEFQEIMARTFIIFLLMIVTTVILYLTIGLFERELYLPLNSVLLASFLIVIFIDPAKLILKKIVSRLFFEGKEVLPSLYTIDEEVEREKTVFLEEMATGLAHEIRNPLGSIKGAAQYLRSESNVAQHLNLFDVIIEEADRLSNVVSQFLNYAKPYSINPTMQDINAVVNKAIALIQANNLSEKIIISKDLADDLPKVNIDGEQLMQVVLNIGLNGVEAMPQGGTLLFKSSMAIDRERNKYVEIIIEDTGKGMSKKEMESIFKPFFTTKEKGTGLGLSICQKIIKKHDGNIAVKSYPGRGTVFSIQLGTEPTE